MFDLVCIAGASVDLVLKVPHLPAQDEKLAVDLAARTPGGLVANTACAASRMGLHTAWSGLLGEDAGAPLLRAAFAEAGVDAGLARVLPGGTSDMCVIMLEPDGVRTILIANSLPEPPPLDEPTLKALRGARFGYTLARPPAWFEIFAGAVHAGGGWVVVDLEATSLVQGGELAAAMRQTDLIFTDCGGLQTFASGLAVEDAAARLLGLGLQEVVVTRGREGASLYTPGGVWYAPAFEVPVVDTTGAGDCFHGAYLAAHQAGLPPKERLRFANAAAAIKVQHLGARGGLPDFEGVLDFIDSQIETT